jgi:hypothetical protein
MKQSYIRKKKCMRQFFLFRNRFKACCLLVIIIVAVLLNNLYNRKKMEDLDKSITSIYQDRLLPATYLFAISNRIYESRMLVTDTLHQNDSLVNRLQVLKMETDSLIKAYDHTFLTSNEEVSWNQFKTNCNQFWEVVGENLSIDIRSLEKDQWVQEAFNQTMHELIALTDIQIGEGKLLHSGSHILVNDSLLSSKLEMALLIVLGLIALILLSIADNQMLPKNDHDYFKLLIQAAIFKASARGTCGMGGISVAYPGQFCGCGL